MLDLVAHGAPGHGPVHLLLISAAEIGFVCDGEQQGCIRAALPFLRMLTGPIQHFQSAILESWQLKIGAQLAEREGFRHSQFLDVDLYNYLSLPTYGKEIKCCQGIFRVEMFGMAFSLEKAKRDDVKCRFCGEQDGDGQLYWDCAFPQLFMFVR